jgi:hypothetical protein
VPVPLPEPDDEQEDDNRPVALAGNSGNSSVWLAKGTKLHHFGPQGQLLQSLT